MNVFDIYLEKIKNLVLELNKNNDILLPDTLDSINVDVTPVNLDFDISTNVSMVIAKINKKLVVDSLEVARNKFPGTSNSLDALCKRFNIDLSRRTKHNALLDCELLREAYINLLDAKEPKFNLSNTVSEINIKKAKDYNKTVVKISEAEIKKHKDFLKSELKKNFY